MLNKFSVIILFLLAHFFFLNSVHSDVYKWVDENGKTVYSDKSISNDADKIKIKKPPEQDVKYQKRQKKQQKLLEVMQEERNEKIALKKEEDKNIKKQKETCAALTKKIKKIKDARFLYQDTDDPYNPKIASDETRKAEENKYDKYIKENC